MPHKNHPDCPHSTKAACEKARRVAIGQCAAMIEETKQCPHWGIDRVDDKPYCGQHLRSVFLAADEHRRSVLRREEQNARIDAFMAAHGQVAHICGERCEFSQIPMTSGGAARSESTSQPEVPLF